MHTAEHRHLFACRAGQALGLGLTALTFALALSLASWSVADPSINHATGAPPRNLMGAPGAILADLLMQIFGLASTALLLPPAVWGLKLLARRGVGLGGARVAAWLVGGVLASAAAAAAPATPVWPLPTGLGGLAGDVLMGALNRALGTALKDFTPVFGAIVFAMAAAAMLAFACALDVAAFLGRSAPDLPEEHKARGDGPALFPAARTPRPKKPYEKPSPELLEEPEPRPPESAGDPEALDEQTRLLERTLGDFGVRGEIVAARPGPIVTLYELQLAPGVKSARVIGLADDIARSMSAAAARIAPIAGRSVIGIELPNAARETVRLRGLIEAEEFRDSKARLPLALGRTIAGEPVVADLARMPHLLVAGATGSGKSVAINAMILSLLYRCGPDECRLIMVDPKRLELSVYEGIPHLLAPVISEPGDAVAALDWAVGEMEERYRTMSKLGVRNIEGFNRKLEEAGESGRTLARDVQTGFDRATGQPLFERQELKARPFPSIVIIVDEMADLMAVAGKEVENAVRRLAQMARAAGLHLVMATQRPSVDVITGTIKANLPVRISFQVASKIDSRVILGEPGAERLLGQGDMLYMTGGGRIVRVHGAFVSDGEIERVVRCLRLQGAPDFSLRLAEGAASRILRRGTPSPGPHSLLRHTSPPKDSKDRIGSRS